MTKLINKKIFDNLFIIRGCRTWALDPPIDIEEKHPNDKRTFEQSFTFPFDILNTDTDGYELSEEDKIRNVSGLKPHLLRKLPNHQAIPPLRFKWQLQRKYNRNIFAKFGTESGINPAICWPTREEVVDAKQDEMEINSPFSKLLNERLHLRQRRLQNRELRLKTIADNMAKMNDMISKFNLRSQASQKDVEAKQVRDAERLEEAREYFGYRISAHDPKYQTLMEERDASRKKTEKALKKKAKEEKKIARAIAFVGQDVPDTPAAASNSA